MTEKADELNNEEWKAKDWVTEKIEITEDQLGLKRQK
jgi:hypothetical protein